MTTALDVLQEAVTTEVMAELPPCEDTDILSKTEATQVHTVQGVRLGLIDSLVQRDSRGKLTAPDKTADKILLAQLLDGVDKSAFTKAKIRIAKKADENDADWRAGVAQVLKNFNSRAMIPSATSSRFLPDDITSGELIEGEMDIGLLPLNLADLRTD